LDQAIEILSRIRSEAQKQLGDGNVIEPSGDITLTATAFNTSGSGNINFYFLNFQDNSIE